MSELSVNALGVDPGFSIYRKIKMKFKQFVPYWGSNFSVDSPLLGASNKLDLTFLSNKKKSLLLANEWICFQ